MAKRITAASLSIATLLALLLALGCGPDTELTGSEIPNTLPDTEVTARPPDVLEAGFVVKFYWSGFDSDGRIQRYQWKISDNGTDGISVQDTLTFDPVTGDTLNPWFETVATDSIFLVSADIPDFPGDEAGIDRSYQTHTFWVRAIDEDGGVDPSPAMVSFNSTTLLPVAIIDGPKNVQGQRQAVQMPSTVTFLYSGTDPDFDAGLPTKVRYLWKKALLPSNTYAETQNQFNQNLDYLVSFEDSLWSDWEPYDTNDETRRVVLTSQQQYEADPNDPNDERRIFYIFAIQAQDTAGAVSIGRRYGTQVGNVYITTGLAPQLRVLEQFLGEYTGTGRYQQTNLDIAAGQELNFSWDADASGYAGEIESYRYGWDIADVTDPNDPGWAVLPGNSTQHRRAPAISFPSNVHTLTVQCVDNSGQLSRRTFVLNVVPVPDPGSQFPILYVDDVKDSDSNQWGGPTGIPLDRDEYRDEFWLSALSGSGGVQGFNAGEHSVDTETEQQVAYRDVVNYRTLLWAGRWVSGEASAIGREFRPGVTAATGDQDKYIWLQPYQKSVGNVFYTSMAAMDAFLSEAPYELPIVFESREGNVRSGYDSVNESDVRRGFGEREQPDGSTIQVGLYRYPYLTMGVSVVDLMSPVMAYTEYSTGQLVNLRRRKACVAMKGIYVDPEFKARYMPMGNVFADTIWSDPLIDHADTPFPTSGNVLDYSYVWSNDEFYNADVIARGTSYSIQGADESFPECEGLCVESMFKSISRYDWIQYERQLVDPDDTWPEGYYDGPRTLDDYCGSRALDLDRADAITNDQTVAFIARKTAPNKPSQVGDVVFGFDAYRFDNTEMIKVVRWVLGEHFGLIMNP